MFARKNHFVGSEALNYAMKYISAAANIEYTVEKLNPYIETLLYDTLLPFFFITEKDVETFENDPTEYILTMFDVTDSPRA